MSEETASGEEGQAITNSRTTGWMQFSVEAHSSTPPASPSIYIVKTDIRLKQSPNLLSRLELLETDKKRNGLWTAAEEPLQLACVETEELFQGMSIVGRPASAENAFSITLKTTFSFN